MLKNSHPSRLRSSWRWLGRKQIGSCFQFDRVDLDLASKSYRNFAVSVSRCLESVWKGIEPVWKSFDLTGQKMGYIKWTGCKKAWTSKKTCCIRWNQSRIELTNAVNLGTGLDGLETGPGHLETGFNWNQTGPELLTQPKTMTRHIGSGDQFWVQK